MEMKRIHINLPEDVHDVLKSMCKTQCRSISSQIQFLIIEQTRLENPELFKNDD